MRVSKSAYARSGSAVAHSAAQTAAAQTAADETATDEAAKSGEAQPARPAAQSFDVATVAGIPQSELTPNVRTALDRLMDEVQRLREEVERARQRVNHLEALADQDTLTPGLNRRAFVRELSRMMAFAERYKAPSSVVYFDVNGMKQINDSLGHAAGDAALHHLADVLVQNVRASDIVGRLGGDEFAVVLTHLGREAALGKAQALAEAIESQPASWNGTALEVRVAYGVHTFTGDEPVDEALHAADRAMYAQKNARSTPLRQAGAASS